MKLIKVKADIGIRKEHHFAEFHIDTILSIWEELGKNGEFPLAECFAERN